MHRGGTSALTRVLNLLGVELGSRLIPAARGINERGFWENEDIVVLHNQVLAALNHQWNDVGPLPDRWWKDPPVLALRQRLIELLRQHFAHAPLWGVKDPRLCRLLPLWIDVLHELGCEPLFVLIARHPEEIIDSVHLRDGMSLRQSQRVYLEYMLAAERDTRPHRRAIVTYDNLLEDWLSTVADIAHRLGIRWPRDPAEVQPEVEKFLDPSLRHHRALPDELSQARLSPWTIKLHRAMQEAARGDHRHIAAAFDDVAADLAAANTLIGPPEAHRPAPPPPDPKPLVEQAVQPLAGALQNQGQQIGSLQQSLQNQSQQISSLQQSIQQLSRLIEQQSGDSAQLHAWIDEPTYWRHHPGPIRISGWCFHPTRGIRHLTASFCGVTVACSSGVTRPDVAKAYPEWPHAAHSGFSVTLPARSGRGPIVLEATLDNGQIVRHRTEKQLHVPRAPAAYAALARVRHLLRWGLFMREAALDRVRRTGVKSTLIDLPKLLQQALWHYLETLPQAATEAADPHFRPVDPYQAWLEVNRWTERARHDLEQRLRAGSVANGNAQRATPKISVIMPVYDPPLEWLDRAVQSVVDQVYQDWELCIADDRSRDRHVRERLEQWQRRDSRIKVVFRETNGNISLATNSAAELATGQFILLLDNDDELPPDCLGEIALHLAAHPETDLLYTDDDKIDTAGKRYMPQFKPDWSPELLLSFMYMCHALVVRRELYQQLGGMRVGFEGAQDYDFALRASERARRIEHLPRVLYHWRAVPGSTASSGAAKPASFEAGRRAVQEALDRRGISGHVYQPDWAVRANVGYFSHEFPDEGPSVAILIPTRNQLAILKRCIESLGKTSYRNYQIVVIDNESDDPATLEYLASLPHQVLRLANPRGGFSFAHLNNAAAREVEADFLLFLNNDTEVLDPCWLSRMVGYGRIEGVGAVGARLLYPNRRVQHAGVLHGLHHGMAGHAFKFIEEWDGGYMSFARVARNYLAVTAACMLTPRKLFLEMGGFDEAHFAVAFNDVDYCYRLVDAGLRCVYCPDAELLHHESASRGFVDLPQEVAAFRRRYGGRRDPYYSPHLSLENEQFEIHPRRLAGVNGELVRGGLSDRSSTHHSPLRVLAVTHALNFTGGPLVQFELIKHLREQGVIDPFVYAIADGPLRREYEQAGIEVIVEEHPLAEVLSRPQAYDQAIGAFAERIARLGIDAIYANTLNTFFAVEAAKQLDVGSIWHIHEAEGWEHFFNPLGKHIAARAVRCFLWPYRVIFVADAVKRVYQHLNARHNFIAIHNGVSPRMLALPGGDIGRDEARRRLGIGDDEVVFLLLGTVCKRKGQHDLPHALARLPQELWPRLRCFIVGDRGSAYSGKLHDLVNRLPRRLRRQVEIIPETPEVGPYYRAADVFVCTSRVECFPRVTLEAMGSGLPIITTPVFGIGEQVYDGVNGLHYPPGQTEQLAAAMRKLIEDPAERRRLADNAAHVLGRLETFDEVAGQFAGLLVEAAATTARPPAVQNVQPLTCVA